MINDVSIIVDIAGTFTIIRCGNESEVLTDRRMMIDLLLKLKYIDITRKSIMLFI